MHRIDSTVDAERHARGMDWRDLLPGNVAKRQSVWELDQRILRALLTDEWRLLLEALDE
jgi:hypothetical protein